MIDEIRRAPDDVLSSLDAINEVTVCTLAVFKPANHQFGKALCLDLTIGQEHIDDPFHIEVVKRPLTKNIGAKVAEVQDEIAMAFEDYIPATENGD